MSNEDAIVKQLKEIGRHLKEIKEGILGETITLKDIEAHLTKQDGEIERVRQSAVRARNVTATFFSLSVAVVGATLFPGIKAWNTPIFAFSIFLLVIGFASTLWFIRRI